MTAALRLPDAFTPGRTSAAAATPTCCCCCSCAVSLISASVALPTVFTDDLRKQEPEKPVRPRRVVPVLLALLPWVIAVLPFVLGSGFVNGLFSDGAVPPGLAIFAGVALVAGGLSALGGSLTPWRVAGQVVFWAAVGVIEFFAVLSSLFSGYLLLLLVPAYFFLMFWLPLRVYARYGPK